MKRVWYVCVALSLFFGGASAYGADKPSALHSIITARDTVKVYMGEFFNDTGDKTVSEALFKARFSRALLMKRSIHFEMTDSSLQSAVMFSGRIEKFFYAARDPILDKAEPSSKTNHESNFAEIRVRYAATNPLTSEVLIKDTIHTVVIKDMTREESVGYAFDKVARMIIKKCFGSGRPDKSDTDTD